MMAIYILFTRRVTEWRSDLQRQLNDVDVQGDPVSGGRPRFSISKTVKYFNAEEQETQRYDEAIGAFARATVRGTSKSPLRCSSILAGRCVTTAI